MKNVKFTFLLIFFVSFYSSAQVKNDGIIENPFGELGNDLPTELFVKGKSMDLMGSAKINDLVRATAVMIPKKMIQDNQLYGFSLRNKLMMKYRTLKFDENLQFLDKPTNAKCTGFLIAPDILVTAGHCAENVIDAQKYVWVFDYTNDLNYATNESFIRLDPSNIFEVSDVIKAEYNEEEKEDYAIIRLDRKSPRTPFRFRTSGDIGMNTQIATIGSPNGSPLKYEYNAEVIDNSPEYWFKNSYKAFPGNSGSPVFNMNGTVEGIHTRGATAQGNDESITLQYRFDSECECVKKAELKNSGLNIEAQAHKISKVPDSILKMVIYDNIEYALVNNLNDRLRSWAAYSWIFGDDYTKERGRFEWAAVERNDAAALKIILENAPAALYDEKGRNQLFYAIDNDNLEMLRAILSNEIELFVPDKKGVDAMFYAMKKGNIPMIVELLPYYKVVNKTDKQGNNLLHLSAKLQDDSLVEQLILAGVDPEMKNLEGKRPEYYFKENEPIVEYLKKARKGKL